MLQLPESESPREIELKLEGSARDLAQVREHPLLLRLAVRRPHVEHLHSTYFDTSDFALFERGVVLRVRKQGRRLIQTVKTRGTALAGLFERGEYEAPVEACAPDLARVPDTALRDWLLGETEARGCALLPVVETRVQRTLHVLAPEAGQVEVSIDEGEVRTAAGALPIYEVELELLEGEPRLLYELALELQDGLALRPSIEGKAERGFALLSKQGPQAERAAALELAEGARSEDLIAAVSRECLRQLLGNQAAVEAGDADGVHQMRVGARRLRAAFVLLRGALPRTARGLGAELRWLGRQLAGARSWDVFLAGALQPLSRARPGDAALDRLRVLAEAERASAYAALREALRSPRYARLVLRLGDWFVAARWREAPVPESVPALQRSAREVARELLAPLERKLRKRSEKLAKPSASELHALRLGVKKLRYASEFVLPLFPGKKARRYARRLARVQDALGRLNDLVSGEKLAELLLAPAPDERELQRAAGFVLGWMDRDADEELAELPRRLRKLAETEPFWE